MGQPGLDCARQLGRINGQFMHEMSGEEEDNAACFEEESAFNLLNVRFSPTADPFDQTT